MTLNDMNDLHVMSYHHSSCDVRKMKREKSASTWSINVPHTQQWLTVRLCSLTSRQPQQQ